MERSRNRQLAINLTASLVGFAVNLGISFFLTPFIVKSLGAAAYGFVGLSNNIITYTQLITIALNSMASRFITIKYVEGDIESANKYFSSVFYSNIILCGVVGLFLALCVVYMEYFLDIPAELLLDVKLLLSFLSLNYIIGLLTNIYSVATFVKNRLDLSSIRSIISSVFRAVCLYLCFALLAPHIWYIGLIGLFVTIYIAITNFRFTKKLTPELKVKRNNFDWTKVKELLSSGIWNTISQLGTIMGQGLDLLIANIFIGATAMGVFSISRQLPIHIITMSGTLAGVFAPSLTKIYAEKNYNLMISEINKSIRINGLFIVIPLTFIFVFGEDFFSLWVPSQDTKLLYLLTVLCSLELILSLPMEVLWSIFTITNKLKVSTLFMLGNHILTFIIVLIGVHYADDTFVKLVILASTRTILGVIRSLSFLPLYGAHCMNVPLKSFYSPIIRILLSFSICSIFCFVLKQLLIIHSWGNLIIAGVITALICIGVFVFVVITKSDRAYIRSKILNR